MKLRSRWQLYRQHLRYKYSPRIANWVVARSTDRARAKLTQIGPLRILIDNTIEYHAVTHETAWISTGTKIWESSKVDTGYAARVLVHEIDAKSSEYRSVRYLAGIAHLCRSNCIQLYTSRELRDERFRQPLGRYTGYGYCDYNLFAGLHIKSIDGFVMPAMGPNWSNIPSAQAQQRERLEAHKRDPLYAALVDCLGPRNSQDAWHIYTAEANSMFCFLSMDFKLVKNVAAQSRNKAIKSLKTKVLTPEELGIQFSLRPVPPHILSYNGASFPVRADVVMPENKRRPLKSYSREKV